jgi:hypothetical protein
MTFNIGFFFSVCGGLALGTLLFGHLTDSTGNSDGVSPIFCTDELQSLGFLIQS